MTLYVRLLRYLRPHAWRMGGNIGASLVAAALDAFSFTLLPLFLNALFRETDLIPRAGWLSRVQERTVGVLLDPADPLGSLGIVIVIIVGLVTIKNVFLWLAGQLGAALQEYVTRDLRNAVFTHLARLPLGYFHRTKTGQVIAKVLSDTEQTKTVITEVVTKTIQNLAQIIATVVVLVTYSPKLTVLALVIAPLLTLALQPLLRKLRRGHRRLRN
ncbi:MAG TPA: ABC transporter transmembrane domain-containing protein, partial [Gemmatimonadaceae bacterium]|nr:ABC transporter transmembrane domain-containing protein [Gemmatimonadaceae bacterium]